MTSLDSYKTLGRSGLRVSPLALGTMTFGEDQGWGASPEASEAILAEYLDRGGNLVETANIYTNRHSEKIRRRLLRRPAWPTRAHRPQYQVLRQPPPRQPQRWRRRP
jgi:aryl-alcohol dehydrogenase-like predicted oxidoreductase